MAHKREDLEKADQRDLTRFEGLGKTPVVRFRLPDNDRLIMERWAKQRGLTLSAVIRMAIYEWMEKERIR